MQEEIIAVVQDVGYCSENVLTSYSIEAPGSFAEKQGLVYRETVNSVHKKSKGQFFSPFELAKFMASFCSIKSSHITILDPGCGTGILCCTLVEHLVDNSKVKSIELTCYENDPDIIPYLKKSLLNLQRWLNKRNIKFLTKIVPDDFIICASQIVNDKNAAKYDVVISNPPYFKLDVTDTKVALTEKEIGRQFNIYSMFMAYAAKLLNSAGEMIFVTPRSFASGKYFRGFRDKFLRVVTIEKIHVFRSRRAIFRRDGVLQDNIILKAVKKSDITGDVIITTSNDLQDINQQEHMRIALSKIVNYSSSEKILHIPTTREEEKVLEIFSSWENKLSDFDIKVSTGRVVYFRAKEFLLPEDSENCQKVPLIWLHNVNNMLFDWPLNYKQCHQYLKLDAKSQRLTIPNGNYIFVRRFSSKDDKHRLIAAPYINNNPEFPALGIENRVNYLYKANGMFTPEEVMGLSELLNSEIYNQYFHTFSGSLNISATELRELSIPNFEEIKLINNQIFK
ncbi:Eco57I restriction-modification methylase domain-containing protein [Aquella oligotrophica]|uniref:site-specific DNA-methyltransferase (adenine-specific) n=1 Tax=Aquella oligotrophica TaxID=2067065 RepID=A0A2I7N5C0_9NEIS|nr:Eco57I restriction-modification methylase domain-containing protein [Aquella oligotrophica]AUR51415.1 methyltransferase [Aquella oligotrophica]